MNVYNAMLNAVHFISVTKILRFRCCLLSVIILLLAVIVYMLLIIADNQCQTEGKVKSLLSIGRLLSFHYPQLRCQHKPFFTSCLLLVIVLLIIRLIPSPI